MYSWSSLLEEAQKHITGDDVSAYFSFLMAKKKEFLHALSEKTGRNTILYFSAFLHKRSIDAEINDSDINALMECVHGLDKSRGLDLILHTPGGNLAATEQIIYYLKSFFSNDIRAIIPQMAMSAGSMIAVSCNEIIMGRQSCLGPFDPQMNGVACQNVIEEFRRAVRDIEEHPSSLGLWQTIISKLTPTFIEQCEQADKLAEELTTSILEGKSESAQKSIKKAFTKNSDSKTHARHINRDKCKASGLNILDLEVDQEMQDLVLGIHHCCMILGETSPLQKIVENQNGKGIMKQVSNLNNTHK